jgi:hypothetical protein
LPDAAVLAYRVFPALNSARAGEPGHPEYLHPQQGQGRLDNPSHYLCWYLSLEASGAVGEVFADLLHWRELMFSFPALPGSRRALGTYEIPDNASLLDLDDARNLLERNLRPTQVIERNRAATQAWALRVFEERGSSFERKWVGLRWWSFHRPQWRILGLWDVSPNCVQVERLDLHHPAVVDAAKALSKPLP